MNLSDILKQFKNIVPEDGYAEKSKRAILAAPQAMAVRDRGIMIFLRSLETGVALVFAGFFILLATGSFSGTKYLAPVQYSVIDPNGLHAEAQAIDIQIQLANLEYSAVASTSESTTATAAGNTKAMMRALTLKGTGKANVSAASSTGANASSTPAPAPLSVDQALQALSQ